MDWTTLAVLYIVLVTSSAVPGLCDKCPDNCLECESPNKCIKCKRLYAGDRCEQHCDEGYFGWKICKQRCKCDGDNFEIGCDIDNGGCQCKPGWSTTTCERRDSTISFDTTSDSTNSVNTTEMPEDENNSTIIEKRPVPLSAVVASVIGVAVLMTSLSVCVVCAVRRAHGKRSFFGTGTESSQKDLISSTQTVQASRSEYSYVDVPDIFNTESHAQNKAEVSDPQVHDGTKPRRNRSVPGGRYVYDTVTDELILIDKSMNSRKRKKKHSLKITDGQRRKNNNINDKISNQNRKRKSSGDEYGRLASMQGDPHEYDSFSELAKRQKAGNSEDAEYSHLETARGSTGDLYNTFDDLVEDRPNERVSPVFEYAHLSSMFEGKAGSYSYVDVRPTWSTDHDDSAGNYHHMQLETMYRI